MEPKCKQIVWFFLNLFIIFPKGTFTKQSSNLDEQMNQVFAECDAVGHILPNIEEKLTKVLIFPISKATLIWKARLSTNFITFSCFFLSNINCVFHFTIRIWKPVVGVGGRYQKDSHGIVRKCGFGETKSSQSVEALLLVLHARWRADANKLR